MKEYEINEETMAIIPINYYKTLVKEYDREYVVEKNAYEIMEDSCEYYGSSYKGRLTAAKKILNSSYKKYTYDLKKLIYVLHRHKLTISNCEFDMMVASYILNQNIKDDIAYLMNNNDYNIDFYEITGISPNLFTLSWIFLFLGISLSLKKKTNIYIFDIDKYKIEKYLYDNVLYREILDNIKNNDLFSNSPIKNIFITYKYNIKILKTYFTTAFTPSISKTSTSNPLYFLIFICIF